MKRLTSLLLTLLFLLPLVSCGSAYRKPHKYVFLPALSSITVGKSEVDEELDATVDELLESLADEYYTPLVSANERVKKGDRVHVSFYPSEGQGLSEKVIATLTATEDDQIYVIPGNETSPDALESIVTDAKVGDTLSTRISYTEDDTDIEELIGRTVTLTVKVHEIARLTVTARHTVKVSYTASIAGEDAPLSTILTLLEGGSETVDLTDPEGSFNTVFTSSELAEQLVGCRKYEKVSFSLTLPSEKAKDYGYDRDLTFDFEVTVLQATETPSTLTDELITELTAGVYTAASDYLDFLREAIKESIAFNAVMHKAEFIKELPQKEYDDLYRDNYNAALYAVVGDVGDYTEEQLATMIAPEVLDKIAEMAAENTEDELKERLVLEYLFDLLDIKLTDAEYDEALTELYATYEEQYYYMLYYYNITDKEALAEYLGSDYLKSQFSYEKLLPILKERITFTE